MAKEKKRPPAPQKNPVGRPAKMVVKIDDSPENVAKALFGKRRKSEQRQRDKEQGSS